MCTLYEKAQREIRRMDRARDFPTHTDPSSRHVAIMARYLAAKRPGYPMLQEEPHHCAISMAATVGALWRARKEIARLKKRLARGAA